MRLFRNSGIADLSIPATPMERHDLPAFAGAAEYACG
jgi:hypothetical protein